MRTATYPYLPTDLPAAYRACRQLYEVLSQPALARRRTPVLLACNKQARGRAGGAGASAPLIVPHAVGAGLGQPECRLGLQEVASRRLESGL